MNRSLRYALATAAIGVALLAASAAHAQSAGFMRMPSTPMQYLGCGYGAGHHAPIVRTPAQHPEPMRRRTFVPACYGTLDPACYAPIGCYGEACYGPTFGAAQPPASARAFAPQFPQQPSAYPAMARGPVPGYAPR
jgi:hypothetical protein